jgi:RNA polymerase sigma-70 factor (ECF subfamily)
VYASASDAELVRYAAERDDEAAFTELVARYRDRLYTFALRICGSPEEAHDAAQDGLFTAWLNRAKFRGEAPVSTWLFAITRSKTLDVIRRRDKAQSADEMPDVPAPRSEHATTTATRLDAMAALRQLSAEFREVVVLSDIIGLPLAEIAQITQSPENTVKTRLFRARSKLCALLGEAQRV